MNSLKIIDERKIFDKPFRIFGTADEPFFLAKDVAERIEHSDVSMMIKTIDSGEKLLQTIFLSGQNREMWFLTEDGLYEVLMQSRKPIAKQFKAKVKEILKDIRKHGAYFTNEKIEEILNDPDTIIKLATDLKEERKRRKELEEKSETLEIALNESLKYYTVAKYNKMFSKGWDLKKCQAVGKQLTSYCRARSIEIRKCETNDKRFGSTNSYPITVWDDFIQRYMLQ